MKQVKLFFATTSLAVCLVITNSCSQTTASGSSSVLVVFEATTPCDDVSKTMLGIPTEIKCEMLKWNLTLYQEPKTFAPTTFKLICIYGLPKQGTRGFTEGAGTIELKGKWTIGKGAKENAEAMVYKLTADSSSISLSFLKPDENLLHLLDGDKRLMKGNGAWSYTLNRINPVVSSSAMFIPPMISSPRIATDSPVVGIFEGRTPCNSDLRELNGISAAGCQIIKCRLTLYQDTITHTPTTFLLQTIYVGKGDTKYSNTGKWIMAQGTKNDPNAIVYLLDADDPKVSLAFMKADDNILFFLDKDRNLMAGNNYCSYTLNRAKK